MKGVQQLYQRLKENVERVIIGKGEAIRLVIIGLLCRGHILIEDVPGTGKTMLAKALAKSIGAAFSRIQFTPDMLPSDVIGVSIYNQKTQSFEFRPGPIMAQIVLTDEINRATPKTQSALLESMEEGQVTVDGVSYPLPEPFLVLATQNPIEYEGTFPLPEAQLDRFLLRLKMGYPARAEEMDILVRQQLEHPIERLEQVVSAEEVLEAQRTVRKVLVSPEVRGYIVDLVNATRGHREVYLGASPRGSLALFRTAQARAAIDERAYVIPDDVKSMAHAVLGHRLILASSARIEEVDVDGIINEVLATVPVPGGEVGV